WSSMNFIRRPRLITRIHQLLTHRFDIAHVQTKMPPRCGLAFGFRKYVEFGVFPDFEPHEIEMFNRRWNGFLFQSDQSAVKLAGEIGAFLAGWTWYAHVL